MNRRTISMAAGLLMGLAAVAQGQEPPAFVPELDLTHEIIAGATARDLQVPPDAPEVTRHPLPAEEPRELLVEVPGQPFRPVDPPPEALAWWKLPFYGALGLPRDLVDMVAGGLTYVPIVSNAVLVGYEVVPVQVLARDPRDWHAWPGRRNARGHGMLDSESWGWFPSLNSWDFTYPSRWRARRNGRINEELRAELMELNVGIERRNQELGRARREARREALALILPEGAGAIADPTGRTQGREAAAWMIPYRLSTRADEGAFALLVASLALYGDAPEWVDVMLWQELHRAQQPALEQARRLLVQVNERYPGNAKAARTLIHVDMLLGDTVAARERVAKYPDDAAGRPALNRLDYETALAARALAAAGAALERMAAGGQYAPELPLIRARLELAEGKADAARERMAPLLAAAPGDPYLNYFTGIAELMRMQQAGEMAFLAPYRAAVARTEAAVLAAPGPPLRHRASQALEYLRALSSELAERPELAVGSAADSPTTGPATLELPPPPAP